MSIVQSIRGKDQLVLNEFRYRQDRLVWHCIEDNCRERARFEKVSYEICQDHIDQASNPNETEKALYVHEIRQKVQEPNDSSGLMLCNERWALSSDAAADISQCRASQRASERMRQSKDTRLEPTSYADIIIS
jgi:hypothetical protein